MSRDLFDGLNAFLLVAEHGSFSGAGRAMRVSSSAVSQTIGKLEDKLGLPLFQRNTRRVSLTEAGRILRDRLKPAAAEIVEAVESLNNLRDKPAGHLHITVPRIALPLVIEPMAAEFGRTYPDVTLEISVEDAAVDILARNIDAGMRLGGSVDNDMIAVRVTPDFSWCVVGAPSYFEERGRPRKPEDLKDFECILYRFPFSGLIHRWDFIRQGRTFSAEVSGRIVTGDSLLPIALARDGSGLAYASDLVAMPEISAGRLETALDAFQVKSPGLFIYFAEGMQTQPKLRVFLDMAVRQMKRRYLQR